MRGPRAKDRGAGASDLGDVDRLRSLVAALLLVGDARALGQRAVPVAVDARVMDEQVAAALVGGDEAEALVVAEPLHGAGRHCSLSSDDSLCCVSEEAGATWTRRLHFSPG